MDGHFRAFSFVDQICSLEPAGHIRGRYVIPAGIPSFPASLVAEAVGQLAAWAAMSAQEFQRRPVAGLASGIDLLAEVRPGQVLELAADLETVDAEAVAYDGAAMVNGKPVIQLRHCVGPMLPVEEFDDPEALRERFTLLRGAGATPGAFAGVPPIPWTLTGGEPGKTLQASLQVPGEAAFFADHFPRRPVLPGTLLMHANLELAAALAGQLPPPPARRQWVLQGVSNVKLRAFTPPRETLELAARLTQSTPEAATVHVETRAGGRVVGSSRVRLTSEGDS